MQPTDQKVGRLHDFKEENGNATYSERYDELAPALGTGYCIIVSRLQSLRLRLEQLRLGGRERE